MTNREPESNNPVEQVHRELSSDLLEKMKAESILKRRSVLELRIYFIDGKVDRADHGLSFGTKY